jgi:hypothetical protein
VFFMSIYPSSIARCQHIKVNGTQCGSPSLKSRRLCFFHNRWREARIEFTRSGHPVQEITALDLPVLEDANSVQVAIMQVLRLLLAKQLDPKIAGLLLYGLQTASLNLKRTRFEPYQPDVVIEPRNVGDTSLGDHAWDPREYTPDAEEEADEQPETASTNQDAVGGAAPKQKEEPDLMTRTRDAIRAQLAEAEHLLALAPKARPRGSSSPATPRSALAKRQIRKGP